MGCNLVFRLMRFLKTGCFLDGNSAYLKLRSLCYGVRRTVGQHVPRTFREMECHKDKPLPNPCGYFCNGIDGAAPGCNSNGVTIGNAEACCIIGVNFHQFTGGHAIQAPAAACHRPCVIMGYNAAGGQLQGILCIGPSAGGL